MRLIIPKAQSEQARWSTELSACSTELVFVDPWQIDLLPETPTSRALWLDIDLNHFVFCVSPTAARALADALDKYWPMLPLGIRWLCNGPRTASAMEQAGIKAEYPQSGHKSEDVYQLISASLKKGDRCLIVKGEGGRDWLENQLQKDGVQVSTIECYRRSVNTSVVTDAAGKCAESEALWLSSEYLGDHLIDNHGQFWRNWDGQWWLSSDRLAQWAAGKQINNIKVANGATPQALIELLKTAE